MADAQLFGGVWVWVWTLEVEEREAEVMRRDEAWDVFKVPGSRRGAHQFQA